MTTTGDIRERKKEDMPKWKKEIRSKYCEKNHAQPCYGIAMGNFACIETIKVTSPKPMTPIIETGEKEKKGRELRERIADILPEISVSQMERLIKLIEEREAGAYAHGLMDVECKPKLSDKPEKCCDKCHDIDTEHTYPAHTIIEFCRDSDCECHNPPKVKDMEYKYGGPCEHCQPLEEKCTDSHHETHWEQQDHCYMKKSLYSKVEVKPPEQTEEWEKQFQDWRHDWRLGLEGLILFQGEWNATLKAIAQVREEAVQKERERILDKTKMWDCYKQLKSIIKK